MTELVISKKSEPSSFKLVLTLAFAGLVSGLGIVGIYEYTKPIIAQNKLRALKRAVFEVVPGASEVKKMVPTPDGGLKPVPFESKEEGVYAAYNSDGELVGYGVVGEGPGFQDTIRLIYGYNPKTGKIIGMKVLDSRETPGLGDKIYKDQKWVRDNFSSLTPAPKVEVIKGRKPGEPKAPNQIDAITGATISSRAVVNIINRAHQKWKKYLKAAVPTTSSKDLKKLAPSNATPPSKDMKKPEPSNATTHSKGSNPSEDLAQKSTSRPTSAAGGRKERERLGDPGHSKAKPSSRPASVPSSRR